MRIVLLAFLLIPFSYAYAEPMVMEQTIPNGMVKVELTWPEVFPEGVYNANIRFLDPDTDQVLDDVSIVYDVVVLKDDFIVELYAEETANNGNATFEVLFTEDLTGAAEVIIGIRSIDDGSGSMTIDEEVSFDVQVVPEFGMIALMIMGISIGVLLVFSKFKMKYMFI